MTSHWTQVDVMGSTANPGYFVWRCSCGARVENYPCWDDAAQAAREHAAVTS